MSKTTGLPVDERQETAGKKAAGILSYLVEPVTLLLPDLLPGTRVLQIGLRACCWAECFAGRECKLVGVDLADTVVEAARRVCPQGRFQKMNVTEDLCERLAEEPFDLVVSLEFVEHLYSPGQWAEACFRALKPGGRLVCSTPYYGYLKNLLIGVVDKWDEHFSALSEGGHVKFFSRKTLTQLLGGVGFQAIRFRGAGRLPYLWKSMVVSADRSE